VGSIQGTDGMIGLSDGYVWAARSRSIETRNSRVLSQGHAASQYCIIASSSSKLWIEIGGLWANSRNGRHSMLCKRLVVGGDLELIDPERSNSIAASDHEIPVPDTSGPNC